MAKPFHLRIKRARRRVWADEHPGTLKAIADRFEVGKSFVSMVFHGHRRHDGISHAIDEAMAAALTGEDIPAPASRTGT